MKTQIARSTLDFLHTLQVSNQFRYERKYTLNAENHLHAIFLIKTHPALFRNIHPSRQINNIYLDSQKYQAYHDNKIGIAERQKVRIRWYNATFGPVSNPKLEFKIKHGQVGDKWSFDLPDFDLKKGLNSQYIQHLFKQANLPEVVYQFVRQLQPTLLNTYHRSYFRSADKIYRLTLDEQMTYFKMNSFNNLFLAKQTAKEKYVIEIKYAIEADDPADQIGNHFEFRMDKHSKYVNGIDLNKF